MLQIQVTKAPIPWIEDEQELPQGVKAFDGTDWDCVFFSSLKTGDWIVEINDEGVLNSQQSGTFLVHVEGGEGYYKHVGDK